MFSDFLFILPPELTNFLVNVYAPEHSPVEMANAMRKVRREFGERIDPQHRANPVVQAAALMYLVCLVEWGDVRSIDDGEWFWIVLSPYTKDD